ncbi:MAG: hypothetical protein ACK4V6_06315 [Microthrixaceae bacterium]
MARPQSSELRRSGTTPAFEPDSISSRLEAHDRPGSSGEIGPVPEANLPGHHPEHDQDKPDLDAFAERFSGRDLDDLPTDTGVVDDSYRVDAEDPHATGRTFTRWAPPIAGAAVLVAVIVFWVRRRRA